LKIKGLRLIGRQNAEQGLKKQNLNVDLCFEKNISKF
jgi:hypothetical protein